VFRAELDVKPLIVALDKARDAFRDIPNRMLAIGRLGAQYARDNHDYQNRTWKLTRSTKAEMLSRSKREYVLQVAAGAPYASYVRRAGLMGIDEAWRRVGEDLTDYINSLDF
jgi:hypothetical protein